MRGSGRARLTVGIAVAAGVATLALSGCGRLAGGDPSSPTNADTANAETATTDLGWDAQALQSIGFSPQELVPLAAVTEVTPTPGTSAEAGRRGGKHRLVRFAFGKSVLHGEAIVQTEEGTKTVVVQRGTVTAINATSITVKSSDGYTLTWTFGDPLTVVERRTQVQPSAVAVGATVGVAGAKSGDATSARLIVIPLKK